MMSQQRDVIEQQKGPNQIVRIRSDSETNLDELFTAVMSPKGNQQIPLSVPMRLRNLPPSFFQQPDRGTKSASHSRESSADNTNYMSPPPPIIPQQKNANAGSGSQQPPPHPSGVTINHPRAHSSPASLQQTLSSANNAIGATQHQHLRQRSYDVAEDPPLPPGWEMAKTATGQRYFLNHVTQSTTWEDPRKKLSASPLSSSSSAGPASPVLNLQNIGPLPDGWEQATTTEGEVYFINHKTRSTSWYDPRIPIHLQQPPLVPVSAQGTVPQIQQLPQLAAALQSQAPPPPLSAGASLPSQLAQQALHLQKLKMERERLRSRQREILHQESAFGNPLLNEMMMRHSLRDDLPTAKSPTNSTIDIQATNVDPFLCGGTDFHSRQESADSGLGLGTNYSLPNTPEDYLVSMDESGDGPSAEDIASELNLDSIQSSTLDLVTENMDSDDLVPSLQEELNADILSDVEALLGAHKDSMMKWL